jgi:glycerol-3-phosphate dehydrogenase (NAD(P)+)
VIAIAAGIVEGRRLGDNARAGIITRGLAEMARLADALGARPQTLMGLAGLGDLTLTCSARQSRNFSLGVSLAEGRSLDYIVAQRRGIAEGVFTARSVRTLAARHGVEMPICEAVHRVLHEGADLDSEIERLLTRPLTVEHRC